MTHTNWHLKTMKFTIDKETVALRGDPSLGKTHVSLKVMEKALWKNGVRIRIELNLIEVSNVAAQ